MLISGCDNTMPQTSSCLASMVKWPTYLGVEYQVCMDVTKLVSLGQTLNQLCLMRSGVSRLCSCLAGASWYQTSRTWLLQQWLLQSVQRPLSISTRPTNCRCR